MRKEIQKVFRGGDLVAYYPFFPMKFISTRIVLVVASAIALTAADAHTVAESNTVSNLYATTNLWGVSIGRYRDALHSSLADLEGTPGGRADIAQWFADMIASTDDCSTNVVWLREKCLTTGLCTGLPEVSGSSNCWYAVADFLGRLKGEEKYNLDEESRIWRQANLTNEDQSAVLVGLNAFKSEKFRQREIMHAEGKLLFSITNTFPRAVLRELDEENRQTVISNVTVRAGLSAAEKAIITGIGDSNTIR